jgi:hypothetical protein
VRADVTVQNQGDLTATFNVTLYVNSIGVATAIVANLLVGTSASCTLTWDTTGFSYGNYTITVKTSILPYEQDTADNTRSGGWVLATVPGDADGNHEVGILDVVKITMCYATSRGQTLYSPNSDLNDNDLINIQDLVICTGHYGQEWS